MGLVLRWALTLILVLITLFFCYMFLGVGELGPSGARTFRLIFGTLIAACIAFLVAVWRVNLSWR